MGTLRALALPVCLLSLPLLAQGPAEPEGTGPAREALADAPSFVQMSAAVPANPFQRVALLPMVAPPILAPASPPRRKALDKKFFLLTALAVGLTVADVELTQRCLGHGTCVELNPTLPHSRVGMYLANIPATGALFYWSCRRKARGRRLWWLPALIDAGVHAGGAMDNLRFE